MLKKVAIYLISGAVMAGVASCNSGTSSTVISSEASSEVAVTAFSLKANENILSSLDSVYFSIDLNNARIFNADSLPKGTNISRMLVNITTGYVSKAELRFKNINLRDTVIDYDSDNTTDSIDFAAGPVTLHLVALDGTTTRDYSIEINVHTIVSDTLMWQPEARRNLPSTLSAPEAQKTVKSGETYVCMTTESGNVSIATAQDPAGQWDSQSVTLSFNPDVDELAATDEALFILSDNGDLYQSTDLGETWTDCSTSWYHITGAYGSTLLGIEYDGTKYNNVTYPATISTPVSDRFPVKGNSELVIYTSEWSDNPVALMIGGRSAAGSKLYDTWAYDGSQWANLTRTHPIAADGMTLLPYYLVKTSDTNWRVTKQSILMAIGGQMSNGKNNEIVYVSKDLGFNWAEADSLMQLPEFLTPVNMAQVFVHDVKFTDSDASTQSRAIDCWTALPRKQVPRWWVDPMAVVNSRAVAPITSWEVPFIYMFGGYDNEGKLVDSIWRSTITTLAFKPLQ